MFHLVLKNMDKDLDMGNFIKFIEIKSKMLSLNSNKGSGTLKDYIFGLLKGNRSYDTTMAQNFFN